VVVAGCAPHATEAILTVSNADLVVPADLDQVAIEVRNGDRAGQLLSSAQVKPCAAGESGDGCKKFPFTVLFVPGDHPDTPAWVSVRALASGAPVIEDAFELSFVRERTLRLDLVLYQSCLSSQCAEKNQVCNREGQCEPLGSNENFDLAASEPNLDLTNLDLTNRDAIDGVLSPRRIFLTQNTTFGNFGGLAGGNKKCNDEAAAAGLSGNFVAILGLSTASAKSLIVLDGGSRPIARLDGKAVATDDTFWEANHDNPINVGANGQLVPASGNLSQNAWTGFNYAGATIPSGTCQDWTGVSTGYLGDPYGVAPMTIVGAWADYAAQGNCTANYPVHLYCIEQ
jgi:hypothetical protein